MARIARVIIPDIPHHLTQRGNYGQIVFDTDYDRMQYLSWIKKYSEKYGIKVWAYCLMDNPVHFIAVPSSKVGLREKLTFYTKFGDLFCYLCIGLSVIFILKSTSN